MRGFYTLLDGSSASQQRGGKREERGRSRDAKGVLPVGGPKNENCTVLDGFI